MKLSIDPGSKKVGWAVWSDANELLSAGTSKPDRLLDDAPQVAVRQIAIEFPEWRGQERNPTSMLVLAYASGVLEGYARARFLCEDVRRVKPSEWKGGTPKAIHNERVRAHVGDWPDLGPDALDAIGIGLYVFKGIRL